MWLETFLLLFTLGLVRAGFTPAVPNYYFSSAFSPYVDGPWAWWNSDGCPISSIMALLQWVKTLNSNITTYSMGVTSENYMKNWDHRDMFSNALIARAAAKVNNQSSSDTPPLTVIIGVYQIDIRYPEAQAAEVKNAFAAAADANSIFPGTVNGIVFTNEYITSVATGNYVYQMLVAAKQNPKKGNLKFGVRIHICEQIYGENTEMVAILKKIANASDFIMCNPPLPFESVDVGRAVESISLRYFQSERLFRIANPKIEVYIGETGWSSGLKENFFNSKQFNTATALVRFWEAMNAWANTFFAPVFMFEAFDEPWKSRDGGYPGESTFGWWYKSQDGNLVAKASQLSWLK